MNDPAFAALVRRTFEQLAESRELSRLYDQWLLHKMPSGRTLGIAMSTASRIDLPVDAAVHRNGVIS